MNRINKYFRTMLLLIVLTLFVLYVGDRLAGVTGAAFIFTMMALLNFLAYYHSDKLAVKMVKAKPLPRRKYENVYQDVEEMCRKMELPMPELFHYKEKSPNAFATGRNPENAIIVLTDGLLKVLTRQEVKAVISHELGHVKNRDVIISITAALLVFAVTIVTRLTLFFGILGSIRNPVEQAFRAILMLLLAPIVAIVIQMAISRTREFSADATAARYMGTGKPLISALQKLEKIVEQEKKKKAREKAKKSAAQKQVDLTLNHMYAVSTAEEGFWTKVMSTHPPLSERIENLEALTKKLENQ
ncbi:MAG: M48 family metalloprotease [Candidatus Dojkabacteria bacterium]|nr:MAG: M48 family metalloprotease [Candidatus Dojkabacteria bacterium]